jgi:hypothetical protein
MRCQDWAISVLTGDNLQNLVSGGLTRAFNPNPSCDEARPSGMGPIFGAAFEARGRHGHTSISGLYEKTVRLLRYALTAAPSGTMPVAK